MSSKKESQREEFLKTPFHKNYVKCSPAKKAPNWGQLAAGFSVH